MAIEIVAVRSPEAEGSKVTENVVRPPASTGVLGRFGRLVTVKSAPCAPPMTTVGLLVRLRSAPPRFIIVKVFVIVPESILIEPKAVSSAADGVLSPLLMETPLP